VIGISNNASIPTAVAPYESCLNLGGLSARGCKRVTIKIAAASKHPPTTSHESQLHAEKLSTI
jgi:hypothetical protein